METSTLRVTVLPEVGAKIAQIHDKRGGHDLLIPARRPYRTIPHDGDWLQHDTSGMDDCFPNVAAGFYPQEPWTSAHLPDLGEWTHGVWNVTRARVRELVMERAGIALPYIATKIVRFIDEQTLEFQYHVENRGAAPMRYLWSAHPLIAVPSEYQLELPAGNLQFRLFPSDEEGRSWPDFKGITLSNEWISRGTDLKVFVTGLEEGWCKLRLQEHSLRFTFDLRSVPVLGLWFNNFGFPAESERSFRCIAIEPCTSASDLLDELDLSAYPVLAPGASADWSLQLSVVRSTSAEAE